MTQAVLIRNADLYAPEHVGMRDILIAGGKIIAVEPHLENVNIPGMETVDAEGRRVTPGLIDQHIHVTGGGGEGGWASRCPELNFSSLVKGGVTSFMGPAPTACRAQLKICLPRCAALPLKVLRAGCGRATTLIRRRPSPDR